MYLQFSSKLPFSCQIQFISHISNKGIIISYMFHVPVHCTLSLCVLSSDPSSTLCHRSLNPPRGSIKKPQCEINPFLPQPSSLKWVAPLTDSALSPIYLQADWFSSALQGINEQICVSSITRAPTGTKEQSGNDS